MSEPRSADRQAIVDLVVEYAQAIDDQDPDRVCALFDEPCLFRAFDGPKGEARSHDEIAVLVTRLLATFTATSHHVSNHQIQFTGTDTAVATTYLHAWHQFVEDRPDGLLWARYHDVLVRKDGRWLFAERTLRVTGEQDFGFRWIPPLST